MFLRERRGGVPRATGHADGRDGAEQQGHPMDFLPPALIVTEHPASLKTAFYGLFMRQHRQQAKEILS